MTWKVATLSPHRQEDSVVDVKLHAVFFTVAEDRQPAANSSAAVLEVAQAMIGAWARRRPSGLPAVGSTTAASVRRRSAAPPSARAPRSPRPTVFRLTRCFSKAVETGRPCTWMANVDAGEASMSVELQTKRRPGQCGASFEDLSSDVSKKQSQEPPDVGTVVAAVAVMKRWRLRSAGFERLRKSAVRTELLRRVSWWRRGQLVLQTATELGSTARK